MKEENALAHLVSGSLAVIYAVQIHSFLLAVIGICLLGIRYKFKD